MQSIRVSVRILSILSVYPLRTRYAKYSGHDHTACSYILVVIGGDLHQRAQLKTDRSQWQDYWLTSKDRAVSRHICVIQL